MLVLGKARSARWAVILAVLFATGLTAISSRTALATPEDSAPHTATVLFGLASLGERPPTIRPDCPDDPFTPPGPPDCYDPGHDHSGNALENLVPRTVVIARAGSVTYLREGSGRHQVAIYAPGTAPEDIDVTILSAGFINDGTGRVAKGPLPTGAGWTIWTTPPGTFAAPGRYLVICTFPAHFAEAMYGWVIVK